MKIEEMHIGMKLHNPLAGRTGEVVKIGREGGLELVGCGLTWEEHVENVKPERLLLSRDARRVIEYLTATDTPVTMWRVIDEMGDMMTDASVLDGLIEAQEAGIVRLDGGKYSIVRD